MPMVGKSNGKWNSAYVNNLPDSYFLHVAKGGKKDSDGMTTPRNLRLFPFKNDQGEVDIPHLQNAIANIPVTNGMPKGVQRKIMSKAHKVLKSAKKKVAPSKTTLLQNISINFTGETRIDNMEGREFLVAPMVMITEGVLNGSNGRLYYPADELGKTPMVWNHKPVVVYHPTMNGVGVSACDPDILTNRKVGTIMNTKFEEGKLKAEAWLETNRIAEVDSRVMEAIDNGEMMELSTGLFTDVEFESGDFNGEPYDGITRNYRPDHLALLPDKKGACSLEDGAGFLRNQDADGEEEIEEPVFADNKQSHENLKQVLRGLLETKFSNGEGISNAWVEDVYDGFFIYETGGKFFKQPYLEGEVAGAEFVGEPVQVDRITEYRTLDGNFVGNDDTKGNTMDKKQVVDKIIKNSAWTEDDREFLMEMNEEQLTKLSAERKPDEPEKNADGTEKNVEVPVKKEEKTKVEDNSSSEKKPTLKEFLADAPAEYRDMVVSGINTHNQAKAKTISAIMANDANSFTQEALIAMPLDQLNSIARLAVKPEEVSAIGSVGHYLGQGGEAGAIDTNAEPQEALEAPTMDFGEK